MAFNRQVYNAAVAKGASKPEAMKAAIGKAPAVSKATSSKTSKGKRAKQAPKSKPRPPRPAKRQAGGY